MMVDFSKIADRVKDVDKIKFADLKKETEIYMTKEELEDFFKKVK